MRSLFSLAVSVWLLWRYDGPMFLDTLECSTDCIAWSGIPGPYTLTNGEWSVRFDGPGEAFFRVRRESAVPMGTLFLDFLK